MESTAHEPPALATNERAPITQPPSPPLPTVRHDGWTGEKIAVFCETLAETAVVAEACAEARMGISGAYAARRRNPLFAAAWDAALSIARQRLADTLLARSMEGNVEQIWRDGELVGERHALDNRLGLQILRRLDRLSEREFPGAGRGPGGAKQRSYAAPAPGLRRDTIDWNLAMDALRTGDDEGVAKALALIDGDKVEEVEGAPNLPLHDDDGIDLSHRFWRDGIEDDWMTDFPPPAGFTGYQSRDYDDVESDERYVRACTGEEIAILDADEKRDRIAQRAEEEQLRDEWLALLKSEEAQPPV